MRLLPLNAILTTLILIGTPVSVWATPQTDVVGYWRFDFQPGFNLVTFPVLPNTATLPAVIGEALGAVEITNWDSRLGRFRYARYDAEQNTWSGDLFLLSRGTAYWVNILGNEPRRLTVVGHPEIYTRFRWSSLGSGWKFYGSTYGKRQRLADLPPDDPRDIALQWNADRRRFEFAVVDADARWRSAAFDAFEPDKGYIIHLNRSGLRSVIGPPTRLEDLVESKLPRGGLERDEAGDDLPAYIQPPQPLMVGNLMGLPVCYAGGSVCNGGFTVSMVREMLRIGLGGELEPYPEPIDEYFISPGEAEQGRFKLALTLGGYPGALQPADRIYLLVRAQNGGETRSNSFEIPPEERILFDLTFNEPLSMPGAPPAAPTEFAIGSIFPNPFNDRFNFELRLPETALVKYILFDLQSREALKAEKRLSSGVHRVSVAGGSLAAGVYLMRIECGGKVGLAKIAHIK